MRTLCSVLVLLASLALCACDDLEPRADGDVDAGMDGFGDAPGPQLDPERALLGGATTVFETGSRAYSLSARNLDRSYRTDFAVGNAFFNDNWVTAPASTDKRDGLGPVFNALSCSSCHFRDGRGRPPLDADEDVLSLLVRLSVPGTDAHGGPAPEPTYGGQFNPRSILEVPAEGRVSLTWEELPGTYGDGEPYSLRAPRLELVELGYGPLADDVMMSARTAPAMIGLGLLEALDTSTIEQLADPDDLDGDGISGRVNRVWDVERRAHVVGRFGWKANQPNLRQQNAGAFLGDIGVTTPLFPDADCTDAQPECLSAPHGGDPEVDDLKLDRVTLYTQVLAVPARRDLDDPEVIAGERLFEAAGCAGCHTMALTTGSDHEVAALRDQTIRPFTDLLLHDMGEGLADGRPDFEATGREWRTPPLWGLGLIDEVNGHTLLLHDGRARGIAEAILWHGGEAEAAREAFRTMPAADRSALVRFLESL